MHPDQPAPEKVDWRIEVEFYSPDQQVGISPEREFPHDDASRLIAHVVDAWSIYDDEFDKLIRWTDDRTRVVLYCEVIEACSVAMGWICMHTLPKKVTLTCLEELSAW